MTELLPPNTTKLDLLRRDSEPPPIEGIIAAWLDAKKNRSGSQKTLVAYRDAIHAFRAQLLQLGYDIDGDPHIISLAAQGWAGLGQPAASTFNQRLAILSSFYSYAHKHGLVGGNPITLVDRRKVQAYASAVPLNAAQVKRQLKAIDRSLLIGARDYALLIMALQTGRRLSAITNLRRSAIQSDGANLVVTFREKGGMIMRDQLHANVAKALLAWLQMFYKADLGTLANSAPLWVSLSPRGYGQPLGIQSVADMCERHFGTSKVHALRHTFARAMQQQKATPSEIQARLGHSSLATTGRYLVALESAINSQSDALAEMFGFDEE